MFPKRLTKIDDLIRGAHRELGPEDQCYYLGEYISHGGFTAGATNDLINNLKKPMERRSRPKEWQWKEWAIATAGKSLRNNFSSEQLMKVTLVPMPPSKAIGDPSYDDRMLQILQQMCTGNDADIRELIRQHASMSADHESSHRHTREELVENYYIDERVAEPVPNTILLFDDVLTHGTHFKAAQEVLQHRFENAKVIGIFLARRITSTSDFGAVDV